MRYFREKFFGDDFREDLVQGGPGMEFVREQFGESEKFGESEILRTKHYVDNRGLFLGHYWTFTGEWKRVPGYRHLWQGYRQGYPSSQVADILIFLHEHLDTTYRLSLLAEGKVASVVYDLGRHFSPEPITKQNKEDNFALKVAAYSPMLCLAEVRFDDGSPPILLSRYIDFPTDVPGATNVEPPPESEKGKRY